MLFVNDLSGNAFLSLSHHSINSAIPALVLMVWGHLLYSNPKILPLGRASALFLFVICNMLRFMCQKAVLDSGGNASLLMWYSSFGLVNAVCVVRFCLGCRCLNAAGLLRTAVCYVGSLTYGIYLVHFMVRYYIFMIMQEKVESLFEGLPHFLSVFLFSFSMMAIVFVVTGVLVAIYRFIGGFFCALRRGRKPAYLQEGSKYPHRIGMSPK